MADLADLPGLAARISADLDRDGIPHAITGAIAMAAHGYVRATRDLDVLVVASSLQLPRVFEIIRHQGFLGDDRELLESLRDRYVASLRSGPVTIEILVPVLPYHREIVDRVVWREMPGGRVPFVSIEDLVVLKMLWHRAKDVPDVHALIATTESFDAEFVCGTLAGILPADDPRHLELEGLIARFGPGSVEES